MRIYEALKAFREFLNAFAEGTVTVENTREAIRKIDHVLNTHDGVYLIAEERTRQLKQEGYSEEHDDAHKRGHLAFAALGYLHLSAVQSSANIIDGEPKDMRPHPLWPWSLEEWKPSNDQIKNLVRAGALIAAEIDRLQRLKAKEAK